MIYVFSSPTAPRMNEFKFLKDEYALGENASAVCIALSGRQPFHFRWLKDGNLLTAQSGRVSVTSIALVSTLEVQEARLVDHANYTCEVSNSQGRASHSASLRITGKFDLT
jgi:hypothetical protein